MVNNNWLAWIFVWILVCMLKTYNLMVEFLKYEFNNKLLSGVTLLRIIPGVTLNNVTSSNIF